MNRRSFLSTLGAAAAQAQTSAPPNILFILADDLGYGDLGCYGQRHIPTPHIDKLAAGGLRFTDAYAGCTVCAPSRSVLMTGKHTGHTSVRANSGGVPLLPEDITVAEVLHTAGYKTGCFGKWGLGDKDTTGVPTRQGFDAFHGVLHQIHAHFHYPGYFFDGENIEEAPRGPAYTYTTYTSDIAASSAEGFIRQYARQKTPFFCYLPVTLPHLELIAPREKMEQFDGKIAEDGPYLDPRSHYANQAKPRTAYAAMISRLDDYVGRLMELLETEKVAANTIVFFCSDNGSATPIWNDGGFFNSSGPLRGHKTTFYEGGIRTPMIVHWKGRIKPGVSSFPWMFQDVLPTLAELARATPPKDIDGISIVPTLLGTGKQARHDYLYWELPRHYPVSGNFAEETPRQAVRQGKWKAVRPEANGPLELYDLSNDPGEHSNVAARNPAVVAQMEAICKAARTPPRKQPQPVNLQWK
jgi:arylsulfatase A-like enzyme